MDGPPPLHALRALIVDDDRLMVDVVAMVLNDFGLAVVDTATDGATALARLAATSFDLLVCDLNMPEMDGIRLLGHVADLPTHPAIILFSGEDPRILEAARQFAEAKSLTILGTATKPVTHASFGALLQSFRPSVARSAERPGPASLDDEALRCGLAEGALALAYQPKVDLVDGTLAGAEALLRWRDRAFGIVSPPLVVEAAERTGLVDDLTLGVLAMAVRDRAAFARAGIEVNIACNLSMHNLHADMIGRFDEIVARGGDEPRNFTLEVTETHRIEDLPSVLEALIRLRLQGFRIAIDDYGTGAATMQFLMQLPSTELKIDRAFVGAAGHSDSARALLQSTIALGVELGQDVVAEGVETADDDRLLRALGCRYAQGYLYGKPMHPDAFVAWNR